MKNQIRDWFEQHDCGGGDFCIAPRSYPFDVVPPTLATDTVLYCTKPHTILKLLHELGEEPPFAAVLRRGLPSEADADWLAATAGSRRLLFLGDADLPSSLGPWCAGLLNAGRKIELEALFSYANCGTAKIAANILAT
jgi:hypothetical protein